MRYDFSGWATRNDLKCSDGRTIRKDAFKSNDGDGSRWSEPQHNEAMKVLGQRCWRTVRTAFTPTAHSTKRNPAATPSFLWSTATYPR